MRPFSNDESSSRLEVHGRKYMSHGLLGRMKAEYVMRLTGCGLAIGCGLVSLSAQAQTGPKVPVRSQNHSAGRHPPTQEIYSNSIRTSQYVTVRDGTRLAIDIYRPELAGRPVDRKLPVILVATPYHRSSENNGEILTFLAPSGNHRNVFAEVLKRGYVIASLDIRGRGASFGTIFAGGMENDTNRWDLYDVVEWLAGFTPARTARRFRDTPWARPEYAYPPVNEWNYLPNYRLSKIPVFQYTGWRDLTLDADFAWYQSLAGEGVTQKLIIGPWYHCE